MRSGLDMMEHVLHTRDMQVRMLRSGRKHKIGLAHVRAAILNAGEAMYDEVLRTYSWVGVDDRGVELEIVAIDDDKRDGLAIIHAMPTAYRRKK